MSKTSAIGRWLARNNYGAEARVLEDGTMIGPKVTGYHGSTDPWLLLGKSPDFRSQGGLHVGNKTQATEFSQGGGTAANLASAIARAIARAPQPRGSQTYRKK